MESARNNDKLLIEAFVNHLRVNGHPGLRVECWPDAKNRNTPEIDALADGLAIEHTSVDAIENQRRDDDWFMKVVGGLREEFKGRISYRLRIFLCWESIKVGQDWNAIKSAFRRWIEVESRRLPDGERTIGDARGIPFRFFVQKDSHGRPAVLFGRRQPKDTSLPKRIRQLMDDKASKLAPYRAQGKTAILLLESSDLALMNRGILIGAIRRAYPKGPPPGIDLVWFADTSVPEGGPVFREITNDIIG